MGLLNESNLTVDNERLFTYRRDLGVVRIIAIIRIRNEALILKDTLDSLSMFADGIVCYDDASTDGSFNILKDHPKVLAVVRNYKWKTKPSERISCETEHRNKLLHLASTYQPEWVFCADADERYIGDIKGFIDSDEAIDVDIVKIQLFDAYLTQNDYEPITSGKKLLNFRRFFGPERRDIIMMWRLNENIKFRGLDSREPVYTSNEKIITRFYCQHYGKSLSIQHWEETCEYYINHFPFEPYGAKWIKRRGKAIHVKSDFDMPLYEWGTVLFENAINISP
ncbi:glycosyltransferase family 2 protein [Paenibacillus sp. FSL R7-0345]|uniref:glycosyltransferase family 2 protein n=1 Tax=Paenibacillus sp. FSL R7-0345 TaxID=2954535 RepID=UPI00315AB024